LRHRDAGSWPGGSNEMVPIGSERGSGSRFCGSDKCEIYFICRARIGAQRKQS
jgi:hypothetical protein